jgi:hypothetical protein
MTQEHPEYKLFIEKVVQPDVTLQKFVRKLKEKYPDNIERN